MSVNVSDSMRPGAVTEQLSETIVMAVAEAKGIDPLDLDPLYDVVDPDALDALFQTNPDGSPQTTGRITFRLAGCTVIAHSDGTVDVVDPNGETDVSVSEEPARGGVE